MTSSLLLLFVFWSSFHHLLIFLKKFFSICINLPVIRDNAVNRFWKGWNNMFKSQLPMNKFREWNVKFLLRNRNLWFVKINNKLSWKLFRIFALKKSQILSFMDILTFFLSKGDGCFIVIHHILFISTIYEYFFAFHA